MALNLLNDRAIKAARAKKREYLLADGENLYLRVRPDGVKTWFYIYRLGGKRPKHGLGIYPDVGLQDVRKKAAECRVLVAKSIHPADEAIRSENENLEKQQQLSARFTVRSFFYEWQKRELSIRRKDKGAVVEVTFERNVFPQFADYPLDTISRKDIHGLMDKIVERGALRTANVVRAELRQMFSFALDREVVQNDPTARIKKVPGGDKKGERYLQETEVKELFIKLPESGLTERLQTAVRLLLATGVRVGELSRAQWKHVDLVNGLWKIPSENVKTKVEHLVHLSPFAVDCFKSLPRFEGNPYVLTGREGFTHLNVQTICKAVRDRQRTKQLSGKTTNTTGLILTNGEWTPHDCRRTSASLLQGLGFRGEVIKGCLNQKPGDRITETYQRHELMEERKDAFTKLGELLSKIAALARAAESKET